MHVVKSSNCAVVLVTSKPPPLKSLHLLSHTNFPACTISIFPPQCPMHSLLFYIPLALPFTPSRPVQYYPQTAIGLQVSGTIAATSKLSFQASPSSVSGLAAFMIMEKVRFLTSLELWLGTVTLACFRVSCSLS